MKTVLQKNCIWPMLNSVV